MPFSIHNTRLIWLWNSMKWLTKNFDEPRGSNSKLQLRITVFSLESRKLAPAGFRAQLFISFESRKLAPVPRLLLLAHSGQFSRTQIFGPMIWWRLWEMWYYESLANRRPCNAWADDSHISTLVRRCEGDMVQLLPCTIIEVEVLP